MKRKKIMIPNSMITIASGWLILFLTLLNPPANQAAAKEVEDPRRLLFDYIEIDDDSYGFELKEKKSLAVGNVYVLRLTSQTWRDHDWQHWLTIFVPDQYRHENAAIMVIEGGSSSTSPPSLDLGIIAEELISTQIGVPIAILQQVPNQPMFGGLREDALIAMTFDRFLEEGDEDWPLLLPMTKSAVRGMDAIQEFLADHKEMEIERFIVGGGSKRGWTSYLTAAVDDRVKGVVPIVIDMLNIPSHMRRQKKSYGRYSSMISDYTDLNLIAKLSSDEGEHLVKLIDPYSYRDLLTMPKLIILGTNDPYWVADAASLYFPQLPDPKYLHYGVGVGHDVDLQSAPTLLEFFHTVFADRTMPEIQWRRNDDGSLTVSWQEENTTASLMTARSQTRDFRQARWREQRLRANDQEVTVKPEKPELEYLAYFVQVEFHDPKEIAFPMPIPVTLATPIKIIPDSFPY